MFWILCPCRNLQHSGHSTACRQLRKKSSVMGDKLNQTNNSADNNLGHFFKATECLILIFDNIAKKVKIMEIILNISPYFVLAFFHVRSS